MPADIVQAQYEMLEGIAQRFGCCADGATELHARIQQCCKELTEGDWEGRGAAAFSAEMDGTLFPAVQRLIDALREAQSVTLEVKFILEQADEEASAPFRGRHHSGGVLYASFGPIFASPPPTPVASAASPPQDAWVMTKKDVERYKGKVIDDGKCAKLAQKHFGNMGKARTWQPGVSLMERPNLEYGTVIATFTFDEYDPNGYYPNASEDNHVAIFLYYFDKDENPVAYNDSGVAGVMVLDQWPGKPASLHSLEFLSPEEAEQWRAANPRVLKTNKKGEPILEPDGRPKFKKGGLNSNKANDMYVVRKPSK